MSRVSEIWQDALLAETFGTFIEDVCNRPSEYGLTLEDTQEIEALCDAYYTKQKEGSK